MYPLNCFFSYKPIIPYRNKLWPFTIVMRCDRASVSNRLRSYIPRSDFLISKSGVPRLLVEFEFNSSSDSATDMQPDCIRMLLQSSAVVRFANMFLDAFKLKKNFVLVAIYINDRGGVFLYTLFQRSSNSTQVWSDSY
jgi:hypothetical protein